VEGGGKARTRNQKGNEAAVGVRKIFPKKLGSFEVKPKETNN